MSRKFCPAPMKFAAFIIFLNIIAFIEVSGQPSDVSLIKDRTYEVPKFEKTRTVIFGISEKKNPIIRYNPVTLVFSSLMFTYQKWLSQQISADCLYSPSCSEFTRQLFKRYGFFGGFVTASDRLMRCDRISATTINPVSQGRDGKVQETTDRYVLKKQP